MDLKNLKQPPLNTTLMGVVRSVADYYEIDRSTPYLYGGSGHGFLMNIHEELCPSGPYVWKYDEFIRLLGNIGIQMTDLGFYHPGSSSSERAALEEILRSSLADGIPCSLVNMENQLITSIDDSGFLTAQPWGPTGDVTPSHLTFVSWDEFGDEYHTSFFAFHKTEQVGDKTAIAESLAYCTELSRHPEKFSQQGYGIGPQAYANWIKAVDDGHGGEHGAWWNAMVWSECRSMASKYFEEVAAIVSPLKDRFLAVAHQYGEIAGLLNKAGDKEMPAAEKRKILKRAEAIEAKAVDEITLLSSEIA